METQWPTILSIFVATVGIVTTIVLSNRSHANQQIAQIAKLEQQMVGFIDRISTMERHIQKQIDELKARLGEFEREMRREKSIR